MSTEPLMFDAANPLGLRKNPWVGRVTVVETVYYGSEQDPSKEIANHSYSVYVKSDEQPWGPRRQTVGEEWVLLDLGYLAGTPISELAVENMEGLHRQVIPSQEELEATAAKVVELGTATGSYDYTPFAKVHPGRSARFCPCGLVFARCVSGQAKLKVAAAPGDG